VKPGITSINSIKGKATSRIDGIGYVTFCTQNYIEILHNLIKSVESFSRYPVHVFTINFELNFDSSRISSSSIYVDESLLDFYSICACKLFSAIHSPFDLTLLLDCDMIVTPEIDNIFDIEADRVSRSSHPLFCRHPHDNLRNHPRSVNIKRLFNDLGVQLTDQRYLFASFIFTRRQIWLFQEAYELMLSARLYGEDEVVLNALVHKYRLAADIGYCYLLNGTDDILRSYADGHTERSTEIITNYVSHNCPIRTYIFHGHLIKDPSFTSRFLRLMTPQTVKLNYE
jgi:hypothetical protein